MTPSSTPPALTAIRLLHTIVWAFFVAAIVAIPIAAWQRRAGWFWFFTALVFVEVIVLALNQLKCPLTDVAARYTTDRRDNFDIYLPGFIARNNKEIFGPLYLGGVLFGVLRLLT